MLSRNVNIVLAGSILLYSQTGVDTDLLTRLTVDGPAFNYIFYNKPFHIMKSAPFLNKFLQFVIVYIFRYI